MQKTLLYLLLLAILGAGVYFFVYKGNDNVYGRNEAGFAIKDTSMIGKVYLVNSFGQEISLERTDTGWIVNGDYKARQSVVNNLLRVISLQEALYPVPEAQHNNIVKTMAAKSIKVELYNRKGKKLNTFYVGGPAYNYTGTYMLQEHAKRPYIVQIPNFAGYLTPSYSTDFDDWRDRSVMDLTSDEIQSFSIKYIDEPGSSFSISNTGSKPNVVANAPELNKNPVNQKRAKAYLNFFTEIYCEGYLNGIPEMDSLLRHVPKFCEMEVTAKNGWKQHIDIYYMPLNKRSKNLGIAEEGDFDIDRFYGVINNGKDTVLLQAYTFDKFFRRASEFFEPEKPVDVMGVTNAQE